MTRNHAPSKRRRAAGHLIKIISLSLGFRQKLVSEPPQEASCERRTRGLDDSLTEAPPSAAGAGLEALVQA